MILATQILHEALQNRKMVNPSYSLRAFARDLGVTPAQLSHVLSGKRGLGTATAKKVIRKLGLSDHETHLFLLSLKAQFAQSKKEKMKAQEALQALKQESGQTRSLQLDLFKTIAQWHHLTLLELIKISGKQSDPIKYFSKKLKLSEADILLSLERLERLELITPTQTGYQVNQDSLIADQGIPTEAVKKFHEQILTKAIAAVHLQGKDERYGISAVMPVKVKDLNKAKQLIQDFRTEFSKLISDHEQGEEVYALSLQFYQLTQTV
jgi:uncharacterized protein (TIGR02147 family)